MNFQIDDNQPFFLQAIDYQFARAEEDLNSVTDSEWIKAPLGFSMGMAQSLIHLPVSLFQFAKHFVSEFPQRVEQTLRQNPYNPLVLVGAPLVEGGKLMFYEPMVGLVEQLKGIGREVEQTGRMNWHQAGAFAFGASLLAKGATDAGMGMLNTIENIGTGLANSIRNSGPPPLATTGTLVTGEAAVTTTSWSSEIPPPPIIQRSVDDETKGGEVDPVFLLRALDKALVDKKYKTALGLLDQMIEIGGRDVLYRLQVVAEVYLGRGVLLEEIQLRPVRLIEIFLRSQVGLIALKGLARHKSPHALTLARQLSRGEKVIADFVYEGSDLSRPGPTTIGVQHFYRGFILEPTHPLVICAILDVLEMGQYGERGIFLLKEVLGKYKLEEVRFADVKVVGELELRIGDPKGTAIVAKALALVAESGDGGLLLKLLEANPELAEAAFKMEGEKVFVWPPRFGPEDVGLLQKWLQQPPPHLKPYWSEIRVLALRQTDFPQLRFQAAIDILKEPEAVRRFISGGGEVRDALGDVLRNHVMGVESIVEEIVAAQPRMALRYSWISNESVWSGIFRGLGRRLESEDVIEPLIELSRRGNPRPVEILIEGYEHFSHNPSLRERFARALEETGYEAAADFFDSARVRLPSIHFVQRRRLAERAARTRAAAGPYRF